MGEVNGDNSDNSGGGSAKNNAKEQDVVSYDENNKLYPKSK